MRKHARTLVDFGREVFPVVLLISCPTFSFRAFWECKWHGHRIIEQLYTPFSNPAASWICCGRNCHPLNRYPYVNDVLPCYFRRRLIQECLQVDVVSQGRMMCTCIPPHSLL